MEIDRGQTIGAWQVSGVQSIASFGNRRPTSGSLYRQFLAVHTPQLLSRSNFRFPLSFGPHMHNGAVRSRVIGDAS